MKKVIFTLLIALVLFLPACGATVPALEFPMYETPHDVNGTLDSTSAQPTTEAVFEYFTFEEALIEFPPTDVVIAQYVGHRPFGENLTEFEFVVLERVLGDAADRIFVYEENVNAHVMGIEREVSYMPANITFDPGTEYLLPLQGISSPYARIHEDGFRFILNIAIDLNDPASSTMYSEPLYQHAEDFDFSRSISRQQIVSHMDELTRGNPPARGFIRSEEIVDILHGSPYVFVVEVDEPLRMAHEMGTTDWMVPNDLYFVTIVQVLKGDIDVDAFDAEFVVMFFADTVLPGEQHIVAVAPNREGNTWFRFTSRNSLFRMDQLDEIMFVLGQRD